MRPWPLAITLSSLATMTVASDFRLALPVDCALGQTCFIQQYVDRDPGPGATDFRCGPLVYDGHKGTDFALPSLTAMQQGVDVLAAAPGIVRGTRDALPDIAIDQPGAPDVSGQECGNGVVVVHADGWETQYCHLKKGSVSVSNGQRVEAGTVLGEVGLSGQTQFPHLHLAVRRNGAVVDPFAPSSLDSCGDPVTPGLWADPITYMPGGIIGIGFAPAVPAYDQIKTGTAPTQIDAKAPALVLWAYLFGGQAGDKLTLEIDGPNGPLHRQQVDLDRTQAQLFRASGLRLRADRWPAGAYTGTAQLIRNGQVISTQDWDMTLP